MGIGDFRGVAAGKRHRGSGGDTAAASDGATDGTPLDEEAAPQPASASATAVVSVEATPSMAQFLEIKTANPDSILWYRMGDFYELFFEDAVTASQALGIVLTKRGKHLGQDIPMCGVPIHRADEYLQRLIKLGYRIAVCEQLEDPAEARKRGAKAVVRRDVVRLVTPGTLTEDTLLDAKARNYLTAVFRAPGGPEEPALGPGVTLAMASLDISTGEFEVGEIRGADLPGELVRLAPGEVIAADQLLAEADVRAWIGRAGAAATPVPQASFDSLAGERGLKAQLKVGDLGAFGSFTRAELAAIGAVLRYVDLTQIGKKPVVRPPRRMGGEAALLIDAASRASLELIRSTSGDKSGSLLHAIDRTVTGAGARELSARLAAPLRDPPAIDARLDAVAFFASDARLREDIRASLKGAPDIARAISRLAFGRGGPRDLASIGQGLTAALLEKKAGAIGLPTEIARIQGRLAEASGSLLDLVASALVDEPPHLKRDGGFVRKSFRASLDEALALRDDSRRVMAALEVRYVEQTGIKTLKIRHNNILGYFIEVTQANAKPLTEPPLVDTFRHRQSMANAMRFTTIELAETEGRIASAAERALAIEQEIFAELAAAVAHAVGRRLSARRARSYGGPRRACRGGEIRSPRHRREPGLRDPRRPPSGRRAIPAARQGWPVRRQRLRTWSRWRRAAARVRRDAGRTHLAGHGAEHGRQIDLPSPERLDRNPRPDGLLCSGSRRAHWRRRPPLQPRWRRRRSCPRPLDLHGGDGRDGSHPQSSDRPITDHSR